MTGFSCHHDCATSTNLLDKGVLAFGRNHRQSRCETSKKQGDGAVLELVRKEMLHKQSDISATLVDISQHYAERIKVELLETLDVVWKISAATLPNDKVKLYQN